MDVFYCNKKSRELPEKVYKILVLALLLPLHSFAGDFTSNLIIQSDKFEMSLSDRKAYLTGNVKIDSDEISVRADGVELTLANDNQEMKSLLSDINNIKSARIFVEKDYVKASVGKYKIECKEITGNMADKRIVMKSAKITDGKNQMSGDKITYDMDSQSLSVTSNQNNKVKISIKEDGIKALERNN
jgi:lipopolysaccharide transport protein LptA